ncbi:hypothetical protein GDO86_015779 [Hymenochirus boettgeri]|uniref:Calpain 11 n=1 Tax=Hymenochirus boettgeri TaxID=247094 RepID=A0A8T2JUC3_9PIPI|nr:hypothetical protein GDO86_015779 [Hymenochirus boettgeri]
MPGFTVRLLQDENSSPAKITPYLGQDYHKLVQQCLQQGRLFEDPCFHTDSKSLGYNKLRPGSADTIGIQWRRPQDICQFPQFICENMKWTDVCQGNLGNCWFLAAAASLTQYPLLMQKVVPSHQSFKHGYAGIFHFQFWQYGEWVDVVVDDRLPVQNGKLVFVTLRKKSEFWASLLEKACKIQNQFYRENVTPQGLVKAHAYSIIATFEMELNALHHGHKLTLHSEKQLQVRGEDGEFWIQMEDFLRFFNILEVCNLTPDSLMEDCLIHGTQHTFLGRWVIGTMQRNRRQQRSRGQDFLTVGFEIYQFDHTKLVSERKIIYSNFLPVALSQFVAKRDVTQRYQLAPGRYLIIPSTFHPHQESEFILRVFTEKHHTFKEIDYKIKAGENVFMENKSYETIEGFTAHFKRLAGQESDISPEELQRILTQTVSKDTHLKTDRFTLDTCRLLVKIADKSGNEKLQLEEFRKLWGKIKEWENIFTKYDKDRSGTMDLHELRLALEAAGFNLNNQLVESLCKKYGNDIRQVDFDSFLSCMANLTCVFVKFRDMDQNNDGVINISKQQLLQFLCFF